MLLSLLSYYFMLYCVIVYYRWPSEGKSDAHWLPSEGTKRGWRSPNLPTDIVDFRGLDSSIISI